MKQENNTALVMFHFMIKKPGIKAATTKLTFFMKLEFSNKPEADPTFVLVRVSSECVRPVRHPYPSMFPIKFHCDFIEHKLWCECSPVKLLLLFARQFFGSTYELLLLIIGVLLIYQIWKENITFAN